MSSKLKRITVLNLMATKEDGKEAVSLQISEDMDTKMIMEGLSTWLEWGYSIKASDQYFDEQVNNAS